MSKRTRSKANSSPGSFLTFWSTLPGILTGVAALITAVVGLYITLAPQNGPNNNARATSTPHVTPTAAVSPGDCFQQEYAKIYPVEVGSGGQGIASKDNVLRIKLTENREVIGALRLRFFPVGDYFELEEVVDAKCQPVEGLRNLSRQAPVDINNKPKNWDRLQIPLGRHEYSLRLGCDGGNCSADFQKL